ncbi:MAG: right-handed parallel beta-helix repeat-containing protein [Gammaproteobacteria bacterium]
MNDTRTGAFRIRVAAMLLATILVGGLTMGEPPSPPMKKVQAEPRTPIHQSDLPLTITAPGSYYLTESLSFSGNAITITASDVTVDLMGFTMTGDSDTGIAIGGASARVAVLNGSIRDFAQALQLGANARLARISAYGQGDTADHMTGIEVGDRSSLSEVLVERFNGPGIRAGDRTLIKDCHSRSNELGGILSGAFSLVEGCVVGDNQDSEQIIVGVGSTVRGCTVLGSEQGDGIDAGSGSSILNNTVSSACVGINLDGGGLIRGNTVNEPDCIGIRAGSGSLVEGNSVTGNPFGDGIQIAGEGSRIESNNVAGNGGNGIEVVDAGNVVIKNSARGNGTNYNIAPGNDVGPIGAAATATSPWANIVF